MDEELLIVEIQNHKVIYDPSHPFYKDNQKKEKAWNNIARVMGVDVDLCKTKWRTLRDSFVKSRKKVSANSLGGDSQREWKYADIMSFLLPHIHPRSSKSKLTSVSVKEKRSCGSDEKAPSSASVSHERHCVSPAPLISGPTISGERDRPHRSRSPREKRGSHTETRWSQRPQSSGVEERLLSDSEIDECYHFAMSLVPQLHRLDQTKRQQAKIGILNLLHNIESSTDSTQQHPTSVHTQPPLHSTSSLHLCLGQVLSAQLPNTGLNL